MKTARNNNPALDQYFPLPPFEPALAARVLATILREEIRKTGVKRAVIGLSGGIDSALSLLLAIEALGRENVTAVMMPFVQSSPDSLAHARLVAEKAGVEHLLYDLTAMAEPYIQAWPEITPLRIGNLLARLRMLVLYDQSARLNALVVGTSNKSEILLGYSTLWGDMASAVNPLGDLYKSQVRSLSAFLQIPGAILNKAPSADLWEGQSDENELGISYDLADRLLYHYFDLAWSPARIEAALREANEDTSQLDLVLARARRSQYKRRLPVIAKLSPRTVDRELRFPRDWNL